QVFTQVKSLLQKLNPDGLPVLVVLDSNHDTKTVFDEMVLYHTLVTPGSYMVVEDGILAYMPIGPWPKGNWFDGDPLQAIQKWLADHREFEVDMELEDQFLITQYPSGWLRKVK